MKRRLKVWSILFGVWALLFLGSSDFPVHADPLPVEAPLEPANHRARQPSRGQTGRFAAYPTSKTGPGLKENGAAYEHALENVHPHPAHPTVFDSPVIPRGAELNPPGLDAFVPLMDMSPQDNYCGFQGGLFPGGSNTIPADHAREGARRAGLVQPLDIAGNPDPAGSTILLSIGFSNVSQEFCAKWGTVVASCNAWSFMGQADADPAVNHQDLVLINGANPGQTAPYWDEPQDENYDRIRDGILFWHGYSEAQVQVVWMKMVRPFPTISLPERNAEVYQVLAHLGDIVRALKIRYPNLQLVFVSSRIYCGYCKSGLHPEPYAYENGFTMKWLVEGQITQMATGQIDPLLGDLDYDTVAPWVSWGPYLWANGTTPRSDGLTWELEDYENTHPNAQGEEKVGRLLLDFFKTSAFSRPWFLLDSMELYPGATFFSPPSLSDEQPDRPVEPSNTGAVFQGDHSLYMPLMRRYHESPICPNP